MSDLPIFKKSDELITELKRLYQHRKGKSDKHQRSRHPLSKADRKKIYDKAGGRCHICGGATTLKDYEADHVFPKSGGGTDGIENYLPSHKLCNNYRWFYESDEVKWILKIGVWAKTEIKNETKIGKEIADRFVKKDLAREKTRIESRFKEK